MQRWNRIAWQFAAAHAVLIAFSVAAFALIVGQPAPSWAPPALWSAAYAHGMAWTGPLYIATGFAAALAGWVAAVGVRRGLASAALVVGLALVAELVGVSTGFPFGDYGYGTTLGPRVLGIVPVVIPLSWFAMLYASLAVAARVGAGPRMACVLAALGLVAWDVLMDPAMSAAFPFWSWHQGGEYHGMPLINWAGWMLTGLVLAAAALRSTGDGWRAVGTGRLPLVLYALNGLFPFALALQRGMPGAALAGAAAMLAFGALPWLVRLRAPRPAASLAEAR
jgi:carotene biosynthesis associated membrane protein